MSGKAAKLGTWGWALPAGLAAGLVAVPAFAGTTGKISGRVVDAQARPVVAATVAVVGQPFGAFTTAQGQYDVLRVPPGTYSVKVSRVGFKALVVEGVVVSADNTTRLDATLQEETIVGETVVVSAERPPVEVGMTSSIARLRTEDIEMLPVQELQEVVNLQAGVVDGHFRGGRLGEVQFQVDGVSVNNSYDNSASLKIDRSLLQEVQVISGSFDAEYGQAMSGVVNAVLKNGSERFAWSTEVFGGGFFFPENTSLRLTDDGVQPGAVRNLTATISGPVPLPKTVFLVNARLYGFQDYPRGQNLFRTAPTWWVNPEDSLDAGWIPTLGDGSEVNLGYSNEVSGAVKVTNSSFGNASLSYQALFNGVNARRIDYRYRYMPDAVPKQETRAIAHGLDWTQTLGKATYLDFSARQNYRSWHDIVYEDLWDPRYDAAGPPQTAPVQDVIYVFGVDFTRFEQTTNTYLLKTSISSQRSHVQQIKTGAELQLPAVRFGTPQGWVTGTAPYSLTRHIDEPPDYPSSQTYWPVIGAGYVQDQLEWPDLTLRAGLRLDYFDARSTVPSDPANPANAIEGAPPSVPVRTTKKIELSPRLGVAYPITDRAGVHFAYGHFYQFPAVGTIFANSDYGVLANLQAGDAINRFGIMGNPDIEPEKSVQYEFGYKQALNLDFGFEVNAFYKDIRSLVGIEFITTYTGAEYVRLTNVDIGDVVGLTLAFDHRRLGPLSLALDYTWQLARGNASEPSETANRAAGNEDPRPQLVYFNWDQRHTFNMTLAMARPKVYSASAVLRSSTGQPYTPVIEEAHGFGLTTNSGRKPVSAVVDLRGERNFQAWGQRSSLFARVFNLFDTRFDQGRVFDSTGSPYYSRFPANDIVTLNDPTHYYGPRRIEIGFTLGSHP